MRFLRRHPIAIFLAVTFGVTWTAWGALAITGASVAPGASPLYLLGLVGPLCGAVAATAITDGRRGLTDLGARMLRFRVPLRWWLFAIVLPLALASFAYVILAAYSMFLLAPVALPTWTTLGEFTGYPLTNALVMWLLLVAIGGFGEETGWRGFLQPVLQRRRTQATATLMVAAIWAAWHLPAFLINANYRAMPLATLPMFLFGMLCGAFVLAWLYENSRRSIAVVAVWHGTFNLLTGTVAARGALAAVETTAVIAIAIALFIRDHIHFAHPEPTGGSR